MQARAFDLLIADTAFAFRDGLHTAGRGRNPLTPTIVVGHSAEEPREAVSGQTMYLPRPVDRAMLVCFASMAIMDGRPARRSLRKPVSRFSAVVNGVPSRIIDISNEGVRLEMPLDRKLVLPPYFKLQVPLMGVAVIVQRMWTRPSTGQGRTAGTWYGGALSQNRSSAEQAWRALVDTIPVVGGVNTASLRVD
jgi:hypothetical protein